MSFWLVSYWRYVPQIFLILEAELTHAPLDAFSHHFSHKALTHTHTNLQLQTHALTHADITHTNTSRTEMTRIENYEQTKSTDQMWMKTYDTLDENC